MHNSMPDGEPNIGPGGLISLNSGGDGGAGGGGGDGGGSDASGNDTSPGATGGAGGDPGDPGSEASGGGGSTDTGDMGSEAANVSSTQSGAASVGAGDSGVTDTGDLGSEAANDAATAAAAASAGMGTFSPYSRPGMVATNISNYMRGNPMTSLGLTALGTMIGVPALGVMNAVNSVYGGGSSGSSTGSGQGEDGSGDGGDERTPISSFDSALLTPDLLDSYNLAKNRDYRLFQSSNNPFYSLQRNPSGGINNVYTEFKKGGRVGFAEGGSMSKGLDYLSGVERRGYAEGTNSYFNIPQTSTPTEDFSDYLNQSTDTSSNLAKYIAELKRIGFSPEDIAFRVKNDSVFNVTPEDALTPEVPQTIPQTSTPTEDFSDYLNQSTDATEKPSIPYEQYVLRTQGVPLSEERYNASNILAPDGDLTAAGFTSDQEFFKARDELADQMIAQKKAKDELAAGLYQTTDPNIIGYSPSEPAITALPQAQQTAPTVAEQMISPDDAMNQYDISNQMNEGQITSFDSIGNRLENIVNNPAIKGFTNFVTGSGNPFQDISQFTPSQQSVINQAIENAAKEGRTNITYADYPKTGVAQLMDDGFSPMEYVKTLGSSIIGNPVDQIKTTLGQFAYDPQQQQIKDFYDFQKTIRK
jgi:hypothetical protein